MKTKTRRRPRARPRQMISDITRINVAAGTTLSLSLSDFKQIAGIGRPVLPYRAKLVFTRPATQDPTVCQFSVCEPISGNTVRQTGATIATINSKTFNLKWPSSIAPAPVGTSFPIINVRCGFLGNNDSSLQGVVTVWFKIGAELHDTSKGRVISTFSTSNVIPDIKSLDITDGPSDDTVELNKVPSSSS